MSALPSDGGRSWTVDWTLLAIPDDELPFDLYIEEDGEGGIGGYFFFRDQRLPGLSGYGLECEKSSIALGESMLGLEFSGVFEEASDRPREG